ncbi:MAG: hypothetical protein DHS20C18_33740 [Saprospiraceae bacterium]|nr:MAG: hypothetical protein DHS20C18_33740 [Saprospiraceae bacterium]
MTQGLAQSTECSCKTDLDFLNKKVKKTPSYKDNKVIYNNLYLQTLKEIDGLDSSYDCYVLLNKLMLALNDNHSKVYGVDKGATEDIRNDSIELSVFENSKIFHIYPRPNINLDSLRGDLKSKATNQIEGIYFRKKYMTIGVYKIEKENGYKAIVLDSETKIWEPGEIIYTLIPYGKDYLLSVGGNITSKRLIAYTERIEDGIFLTMGFQKDVSKTNFSASLYPDSTYVRKEISSETTYLKIGSFNAWYPTLSDAENFYQSLEGTLTKRNLIVDLRDNGGGGDRNSDILLKILKDYIKESKVYVITNNRTASNAEQFAYKLSQFENCETFGNRTNGTAAYELVDDNYNLPCGGFLVVLSSKRHAEYMKIESAGLEPKVKFTMETDWVNQLQNYIQEKN